MATALLDLFHNSGRVQKRQRRADDPVLGVQRHSIPQLGIRRSGSFGPQPQAALVRQGCPQDGTYQRRRLDRTQDRYE
jgi:hypothetical protein